MTNTDKNDFNATIGNTVLCDGFLIPMTDFVIKQNYTTTLDTSQIDFYDKELKILSNIRNYAEFLKQPLKLEMFVPCDDNGNILEYKPNEDLHKDAGSFMAYNKAKEKVLFEGFEVDKDGDIVHKGKMLIVNTETCRINKTVEAYVGKNLKLTPAALDAIFG